MLNITNYFNYFLSSYKTYFINVIVGIILMSYNIFKKIELCYYFMYLIKYQKCTFWIKLKPHKSGILYKFRN